MKKTVVVISIVIVSCLGFWLSANGILRFQAKASESELLKTQNQAIEDILDSRRLKSLQEDTVDPFGKDDIARVLFVGLDTRVGQETGHCDAIQLISINKNSTGTIAITAVPRGTYSPLPPGKGTTSTDYYVSNACGLGGLEYGIQQIEKILGVKPDYLVVVGFSETMGILRYLHLPTTETLQWLRNRHGYAIGEPQRARNHSTFIKQMLIQFIPTKQTKLDTALQYVMYNLIKTDLSFAQMQKIMEVVSDMDIANHPGKIQLSMRPLYLVQDVKYDSEHIDEYPTQTLDPIAQLLSKDDYSVVSEETVQARLLDIIEKNKNNSEFVSWAYKNSFWLQIEDNEQSLAVQFDLLTSYLSSLPSNAERQSVLADYVLEMENRGEAVWQAKGKELLAKEIIN